MMKIHAYGDFPKTTVCKGDLFRLSVYGEVVHAADIEVGTVLCRFAQVELGTNIAYFLGSESLFDDLIAAGATHDPIDPAKLSAKARDLIGRSITCLTGPHLR